MNGKTFLFCVSASIYDEIMFPFAKAGSGDQNLNGVCVSRFLDPYLLNNSF